jgi:hypothetical protein
MVRETSLQLKKLVSLTSSFCFAKTAQYQNRLASVNFLERRSSLPRESQARGRRARRAPPFESRLPRKSLLYFRLFVESVLAIPLAVFLELELLGLGLAILGRRIVPALALAAGESDDFYVLLLGSHIRSFWPGIKAFAYNELTVKALERNRTVDLILTMDMLCQLSYKGVLRNVETLSSDHSFVNRADSELL